MNNIFSTLLFITILNLGLTAQPLKFTGHRPNKDYDEYLHFEKLLCKGDSIIGFNRDFYAISFNKGKDWKSFGYKGRILPNDEINREAVPKNLYLKGNDIIIYSWGKFLISRDFGQTFERIGNNKTLDIPNYVGYNSNAINDLREGYMIDNGYVLYSDGNYSYSKDCNTWNKFNTPDGIQITKFTSYDKVMYIATLKSIYKSIDNGASWSKIEDIVFKLDVNVMRSLGGVDEFLAFGDKLYIDYASTSNAFIYVYDLIKKSETKLENIKSYFLKKDILFLLTNDKVENINGRNHIVGNGEIFSFKESLVKSDIDISGLCTADMKDFCGIKNFYINDDYVVIDGRASLSLNNVPIELKPGCISGNCYGGKGTYVFANGEKYVGDFKNGQYDGFGEITFVNGQKYIGEWKNGLQNGQGTYTWPDGQKYVGEFKDGYQNGYGTTTYSNGQTVKGNYLNGNLIKSAVSDNNYNNASNIYNYSSSVSSILNTNATDCADKIIKSKELPSYKEFKMFSIDKNTITSEICNNSKSSLNEYKKSNGEIVGYSIYYYSQTGKRIKDEYFDTKGRLMQQYVYEYSPNDKAKYMFQINYLGEITALRAVESDGMKDANFESPYPTSKEKAIYRYNHPKITKFTDMCQDCRGTGYGNNNLKRCYICNGAGSITHGIIKY